jgi:hypothetical protein
MISIRYGPDAIMNEEFAVTRGILGDSMEGLLSSH